MGKKEDVESAESLGLLSVVGESDVPVVENTGSILALARRFGELAPKLEIYEINDELYIYNHRRKRVAISGQMFRSWIERDVMVVGGFDRRTGMPLPGSISSSDASAVLGSVDFRQGVREIKRENQVRLPVIRDNGGLELLPWGYDEETCVYTIPGGLEYSEDWTVEQAIAWFEDWFGSMPFADDRSKAVMVAALLTLFVYHLPGGNALRPGLLFEANMAGSGKSICGKACCSIVLGYAPVGKRKKQEEMDKEIEAHLRSKSPVIFLDNLYGSLRSATLDQLITSKVVTFRAMGGQSIVTLTNDAPVIVTGNDLEKNEDAYRRYLQCWLFETGDPNKRRVKRLLDDSVMQEDWWRADALAACFAWVRHWYNGGMVMGETTLGSFESWSYLVGGIVTSAGYNDPIERPTETDGLSPEQADFYKLVEGLYREMVDEGVKKQAFGFDDMARVARSLDLFSTIIGDAETGKNLMIKMEGLKGEERSYAVDRGDLTQQQLQPWQRLLKSKVGQEPEFDGVVVRFGDRVRERRRVKYTLEIIKEPVQF